MNKLELNLQLEIILDKKNIFKNFKVLKLKKSIKNKGNDIQNIST